MPRILVVDNDPKTLSVLNTLLKAEGYDVTVMREPDQGLDLMRKEQFDLLISDIRMSPMSGMDILKIARSERPDMSVVMVTAFGSVETAIEAMKLGAFDYVTKPFKVDELVLTVKRALAYRKVLIENVDLRAQLRTRYRFENIVAESPAMKAVCEVIERVAPSDTTILIYGESGTGKELVAKAIHTYSKRKNNRFIAVNCAALPEPLLESEMFGHVRGAFTGATSNKKGLFEAAEGGTIFLDEIGGMPLSIQGKLLRVLQEKEIRRVGGNENVPVDARVLAATNTRIEDMITQGRFREDLYYRLNIIPINIEPIRNRKEDIMPLINHFLRKEVGETAELPVISAEVRKILETYQWPGNVREMENAIKHALTFAVGNKITKEVLPPKIVNAVGAVHEAADESPESHQFDSLKGFLQAQEAEYLEQVLNVFNGDKEKAAKALKISLATFYRKLPQKGKVPADDIPIGSGDSEEETRGEEVE
jgi:two-component system, NtrC family, response regulator PilR